MILLKRIRGPSGEEIRQSISVKLVEQSDFYADNPSINQKPKPGKSFLLRY
ncbi:hypothetical protein R75461_00932 [Paraburkholderia nemoris]|nr:hypothetical protein R75461_00932 [Paraburkholderia nemoris]CAE6849134.1 hypothetical protein R69619_07364 [Paraburkholderia nemoris]